MKKKITVLFAITTLFIFVSCEYLFMREDSEKPHMGGSREYAVEVTENLAVLAPLFSVVINSHPEIQEVILTETAKMFDGDNDVLFETIKDVKLSRDYTRNHQNKTFFDLLDEEYENRQKSRGTHDERLSSITGSIPDFNLYYHDPRENRTDPYNGIIVTSLRYDIDDTRIATLTGYDGEGHIIELSSDLEPDFPVIVLGINERISLHQENHYEGRHLLYSGNEIHHVKSRMSDNSEPWFFGSPEIWMLFADSCDEKGDTSRVLVSKNLTDFNKENTWWQKDIYCLRWSSITGDRFGIFYMEDDADAWFHDLKEITLELQAEVSPKIGGGIKFSYEKAVSNGVFGGKKWYDEDDYLGDALVYGEDNGNLTAEGHKYSTGNVEFYLKTMDY
ncbi:MAG: hypothetical protein JW881_14570 [Spirochaetales bacterium]|nr:hypothetical protein [Spirochaetales bacterium]